METAKSRLVQNIPEATLRNLPQIQRDLEAKDEEINQLKARLQKSPQSSLQPKLKINHVNPDEVSLKTHFVMQRFRINYEGYRKSGLFENLNELIAETREIFNLVLEQLVELNSENKAITRTLEALLKLDVS
jgi:ABC-type transporter Mla subunit MlaD